MREMTRRLLGPPLVLAAALFSLLLVTAGHAGETAKPEDEWWKKAKPPKKHGPVSWSAGGVVGMQNWRGLEDFAPSEAERADGARGAFDATSGMFGVIGSIEAARFGTTGVAVDCVLDSHSNTTSEAAVTPDPNASGEPETTLTIRAVRLGVAGRSIFRLDRRIQPTLSLGIALASTRLSYASYFPGSGVLQSGNSSRPVTLDLSLTAGFDVALQNDRRRGWRMRFEAGAEHRGLSDVGGRDVGPLAYKAQVGVLYRFEPKTLSSVPRTRR